MKRKIFMFAGMALGISAIYIAFQYPSLLPRTGSSAPASESGNRINPSGTLGREDKSADVSMEIRPLVETPALLVLVPWDGEGVFPKQIPSELQGATQDHFAAEFVSSYKPSNWGEVKKDGKGNDQLWNDGRLIFQAREIGGRSAADDGTVAVSAITGPFPSMDRAEPTRDPVTPRLIASPSEIWIVGPGERKTKFTSGNLDAYAPVLSSDGAMMAFTGRMVGTNGFPEVAELYVGNILTGEFARYGSLQHRHDYKVQAVDFVDGGTRLRVIEDHGETGGHMRMMQVSLPIDH